jgi:hypothetical protein
MFVLSVELVLATEARGRGARGFDMFSQADNRRPVIAQYVFEAGERESKWFIK